MTFDDLVFESRGMIGGVQAKVFFPNGQGASVVRGPGTYGNTQDRYELAVLKGSASKWDLDYSTEITNDVLGWLSPEMVTDLLARIEALPAVVA